MDKFKPTSVRRENRIEAYGARVDSSKRGPKVLFTIIEWTRASEFSSTTLVSPLTAAAVFMGSYQYIPLIFSFSVQLYFRLVVVTR